MPFPKTWGKPVLTRLPLAEDAKFRALAATQDKTPAELAREMITGYAALEAAYISRIMEEHQADAGRLGITWDAKRSLEIAKDSVRGILEGKA